MAGSTIHFATSVFMIRERLRTNVFVVDACGQSDAEKSECMISRISRPRGC